MTYWRNKNTILTQNCFIETIDAKRKVLKRWSGKKEISREIQEYNILASDYVAIKENGYWEILNADGETLSGEHYDIIRRLGNYIIVKYHDGWFVLDEFYDRTNTEYPTFAAVKNALFNKGTRG